MEAMDPQFTWTSFRKDGDATKAIKSKPPNLQAVQAVEYVELKALHAAPSNYGLSNKINKRSSIKDSQQTIQSSGKIVRVNWKPSLKKNILFVGEIDKFGLNCPQSSLQKLCLLRLPRRAAWEWRQDDSPISADHVPPRQSSQRLWALEKTSKQRPCFFWGEFPGGCVMMRPLLAKNGSYHPPLKVTSSLLWRSGILRRISPSSLGGWPPFKADQLVF